jgi:uncharacterized protein
MLQEIIDWLMYSVFNLDSTTKFCQSLNFFLYDSVKIVLLLFIMISVIGFLRSYIPQKKIKKWLSGKNRLVSHIAASLFGAVTPFCSCSSIPIFMGFLEAGVPLGPTFSFLITSPIINEYVVILMFAMFNWKITLAYVISGLIIGVVSGMVLGKMNLERYLVKDILAARLKEEKYRSIKSRIVFGINEAKSIIKKLWIWVLVGVGIGAIIHNYIPTEAIHSIIGKGGAFTVIIATLIGVPLYGSCAAIVPIAVVLFQKGVPIGTALAFMMAVSALSLPEAIILRRVMKLKLIATFFGIVTLAIILTGYLLNYLQGVLV